MEDKSQVSKNSVVENKTKRESKSERFKPQGKKYIPIYVTNLKNKKFVLENEGIYDSKIRFLLLGAWITGIIDDDDGSVGKSDLRKLLRQFQEDDSIQKIFRRLHQNSIGHTLGSLGLLDYTKKNEGVYRINSDGLNLILKTLCKTT